MVFLQLQHAEIISDFEQHDIIGIYSGKCDFLDTWFWKIADLLLYKLKKKVEILPCSNRYVYSTYEHKNLIFDQDISVSGKLQTPAIQAENEPCMNLVFDMTVNQ